MICSKTRIFNNASPSDSNASNATKTFYNYLLNSPTNIMLGCSEQFTSKNVETGIYSDINSICGDYPALLNYEIYTSQSASANKSKMLTSLQKHLDSGGFIGLHDHPGNPVTSTLFDTGYTGAGTGYADRSGSPLASIKSGGGKNGDYLSYLDEVAAIISAINGPVLYRPFHEINGNWFWWNGSDRRSDMLLVWQQTVDYLRNTKGLHNILFVLSFDANGESSNYGGQALSTWWPGTQYVDVISLDYYPSRNPAYMFDTKFLTVYNEALQLAGNYSKPIGIAEYGAQNLLAQTQEDFWSDLSKIFYYCPDISFISTWNGNYSVSKDGESSQGFNKFVSDKRVITLKELNKERP